MKRLSFILMITLCGTLIAQNTFEDGIMSELSKWHLTLKKGNNDSLFGGKVKEKLRIPRLN